MNTKFGAFEQPKSGAELTVSELNREVARLLERSLPPCTVRGELSNVVRAASGHWYFSLKDPAAQVRAVMFRGRAQYLGFVPREGQQVVARALAGLYEPRGDFQLNIEAMRLAGSGDLYQQFIALKTRLEAEGLFDPALKRPLPNYPRRIGVITSAQAAALRDVLSTLAKRAPHIEIIVYPSLVQGMDAPAALREAMIRASERNEVDVLLLVRGGGAIEDLWAFNDEGLARLIRQTAFPVVSGVGHETDFTIADFVADLRAPTPTAAASAASPDRQALLESLQALTVQMQRRMKSRVSAAEQQLDWMSRGLRLPSSLLVARIQHLEANALRVTQAAQRTLTLRINRWTLAANRLKVPALEQREQSLNVLQTRLLRWPDSLQKTATAIETLAHRLVQASPEATLARGYAIVTTAEGKVLQSAEQVQAGEKLDLRLAHGQVQARVEGTVQ